MSFLFAFAFKGIRRCVKSPNSLLFGYRQIAINGKYLWALPTPTTFEKVDQTFIFFTKCYVKPYLSIVYNQKQKG